MAQSIVKRFQDLLRPKAQRGPAQSAPVPQRATARVPDLNILPPKYRGIELTRRQRNLLMLSGALFLIVLLLIATRQDSILTGLEDLGDRLARRQDPAIALEDRLNTRLQQVQKQVTDQQQTVQAVQGQKQDWSQAIDSLLSAAPPEVAVISLIQSRQDNKQVDISGVAPSPEKFEEYRQALAESPFLTTVTLKSLRRRADDLEFLLGVELARVESQ